MFFQTFSTPIKLHSPHLCLIKNRLSNDAERNKMQMFTSFFNDFCFYAIVKFVYINFKMNSN